MSSSRPPSERRAPDPAASLLGELAEVLAGETSFSRLMEALCERSAAYFGAARATLYLLEGRTLVPRMVWMATEAAGAPGYSVLRPSGPVPPLVEVAVAEGRPKAVRDVAASPGGAWWAEEYGAGSAMALPLGARRVVGGLCLDSPDLSRFGKEHMTRATAAAQALGSIVEWGLRADRQETELAASRAVRRLLEEGVSATTSLEAAAIVARVIGETLQTDRSIVVYFPEPDENRIEVATIDLPPELDAQVRQALSSLSPESSEGWQLSRSLRDGVFVDRSPDHPRRPGGLVEVLAFESYASLPLLAGEELVGRVLCGDVGRRRRWSAGERYIADQLSRESALVMDRARLREAEAAHRAQLVHLASHDPLTGLPNRASVRQRLWSAFTEAKARSTCSTLLLVDLDRFKEVNDSFGHQEGDSLLVQVARRLAGAAATEGVVGRLGGDEFAVVLEPGLGWREAEKVAARLAESLRSPFYLGASEVEVGVSVGIASFPEHADSPELLIQRADRAMYTAKAAGAAWAIYAVPLAPGAARPGGGAKLAVAE